MMSGARDARRAIWPPLVLAALILGGLGLRAEDKGGATPRRTDSKEEETMSAIPDALRALATRMQAADASPTALVEAIGRVEDPADTDDDLDVTPRDAAFEAATVAHDEGQVQHVEIQLKDPAALPLQALTKTFGAYREVPRVSFRQPQRVAFAALTTPERPFTVTIFAHIRPGKAGVEDGHVTAVTLRRDAR
jgi:hypothetical protein